MKFGIATFVTDEGIRPDALGCALEERGFDSLFLAELTLCWSPLADPVTDKLRTTTTFKSYFWAVTVGTGGPVCTITLAFVN